MKKLFYYLLLLIPFVSVAQVSTGMEHEFDYGIKNNAQQTLLANPDFIVTSGNDNTYGQIPYDNLLNGRTAQGDTGVLDFAGLSTNSATTINIGAAVGYVVNNETLSETPTVTKVNYSGASNVTVTTVGSGYASYVMLSSAGVISFQNTFPTSAERKAKIWLGKVSHPAGTITLVINEPDYITSPMSFSRDILQGLGGYINDGVYPYENGANLNMNITGGNIHGDGVNFVSSKTTPNELVMGPSTAVTFSERTRVGGSTAGVTSVSVGFYDSNGDTTPDAIPGGGNTSTLHYIFAIPGQGYVMQYGQNTYANLSTAIAAIGKETFVKWSNLNNNSVLIGVLAAQKNATSLRTVDGQAQFFFADKLGGLIGSTAGTATGTMQTAYNNSVSPQITTTTALGAVTHRRGSAADTDNVYQVQNGAGTNTFSVTGLGNIVGSQYSFTPTTTTGSCIIRNGQASDNLGVLDLKNIAGTTTASINGNGNLTLSGNNTALNFIKSGGLSTEYLMGDGSVTSTYSTSNVQTGTSYSLVSGDNNKTIITTNSAAVTITIPNGLPSGFRCRVYQQGTGQVTISAAGTLRYSTFETPTTQEQRSVIGVMGITNETDVYKLFGQLSSI